MTYLVEFAARAVRDLEILYVGKEPHLPALRYRIQIGRPSAALPGAIDPMLASLPM